MYQCKHYILLKTYISRNKYIPQGERGKISTPNIHIHYYSLQWISADTHRGPSWSCSYSSWIYNYLCNRSWRGVLDTTLCDKIVTTTRYLTTQHNLRHFSTYQQGKQNKKCWKTKLLGFTTTYAISAYYHGCCEFESRWERGVQHYVIKFVSDLRQVGGFLRFPLPTKLIATI
jgi:hypothetical protein